MCRRTEEEIGPTVGLPSHRQFVGFFNVPIQVPTWAILFTVIPRNPPFQSPFTTRMWIPRTYSHLKPPVPTGGGGGASGYLNYVLTLSIRDYILCSLPINRPVNREPKWLQFIIAINVNQIIGTFVDVHPSSKSVPGSILHALWVQLSQNIWHRLSVITVIMSGGPTIFLNNFNNKD